MIAATVLLVFAIDAQSTTRSLNAPDRMKSNDEIVSIISEYCRRSALKDNPNLDDLVTRAEGEPFKVSTRLRNDKESLRKFNVRVTTYPERLKLTLGFINFDYDTVASANPMYLKASRFEFGQINVVSKTKDFARVRVTMTNSKVVVLQDFYAVFAERQGWRIYDVNIWTITSRN